VDLVRLRFRSLREHASLSANTGITSAKRDSRVVRLFPYLLITRVLAQRSKSESYLIHALVSWFAFGNRRSSKSNAASVVAPALCKHRLHCTGSEDSSGSIAMLRFSHSFAGRFDQG